MLRKIAVLAPAFNVAVGDMAAAHTVAVGVTAAVDREVAATAAATLVVAEATLAVGAVTAETMIRGAEVIAGEELPPRWPALNCNPRRTTAARREPWKPQRKGENMGRRRMKSYTVAYAKKHT